MRKLLAHPGAARSRREVMALLKPVVTTQAPNWGPTLKTYEPAMYAYLGRAWWSNPGAPFRYYAHFHPGIDLGAAEGAPILASETGIITALGYNGASGLRYNIRIRPTPLVLYVGGHLSAIGRNPRTGAQWMVGEKIMRGERIGSVGHSGTATGNHLHFGLQIGSMIYNPTLFLPTGYNANDWRISAYY